MATGIPTLGSLGYRAPVLAKLVDLHAPPVVIANEISLVVRAGYLEYGEKVPTIGA